MIPSFPNFIFIDDSTLSISYLDNVLRSEMEVGPQKTRPIACKPMFQISFTARVCGIADFNSYKSWYNSELSYGANWFLMIDPIDGVQKRFRFANTQIQWAKSNDIFSSTFSLEAMDG